MSADPVDNLAPATPTGLGVADVAAESGSLRLSWTANTETDLKDYCVYRSTAALQAATAATRRTYIATPGTTHYEAGLTNQTTYYYRLTARDASLNESAETADASAFPVPPVTGNLLISELGVSETLEYVELYNPTEAAISLSGMFMNTGNTSGFIRLNDIVFLATHVVQARSFFMTGDDNSVVVPDHMDTTTLTNAG
ncbi:MAG: hypothetical protein AAB368_14640, partial [bacterium]